MNCDATSPYHHLQGANVMLEEKCVSITLNIGRAGASSNAGVDFFLSAWADMGRRTSGRVGIRHTDGRARDSCSTELLTTMNIKNKVEEERQQMGMTVREWLDGACHHHSMSNTGSAGIVSLGATMELMLEMHREGKTDLVVPLRTIPPYVCGETIDDADDRPSIECSFCPAWYHMQCVKVTEKDATWEDCKWKCPSCRSKNRMKTKGLFHKTFYDLCKLLSPGDYRAVGHKLRCCLLALGFGSKDISIQRMVGETFWVVFRKASKIQHLVENICQLLLVWKIVKLSDWQFALVSTLNTRAFRLTLDCACILHREFFAEADLYLKKDDPSMGDVEPFLKDTDRRFTEAAKDASELLQKYPDMHDGSAELVGILNNALIPMSSTFRRFTEAHLSGGSLEGKFDAPNRKHHRPTNDRREQSHGVYTDTKERGGRSMRSDTAAGITIFQNNVKPGHRFSEDDVRVAKKRQVS